MAILHIFYIDNKKANRLGRYMPTETASPKRLAVNLETEDDRLLIALRAALEKKTNSRLSYSAVIRQLIKNGAEAEGII